MSVRERGGRRKGSGRGGLEGEEKSWRPEGAGGRELAGHS